MATHPQGRVVRLLRGSPPISPRRARLAFAVRSIAYETPRCSHIVGGIVQYVDRTGSPSLLPIFRSQQQAELLALVLGDASVEHTLTELAARTGVAYASVHREIDTGRRRGVGDEPPGWADPVDSCRYDEPVLRGVV